jgi:hypothetical protein
MFAICNVLPFCYETFKQKIFKDKKDDYEESNILFSDKKILVLHSLSSTIISLGDVLDLF